MDVDSYIARYTGETRLKRLLSIAVAGSQIDLSQRQRALKLAEQQMRRDGNALLYNEVFGESEEGIRRKIATHDPNLFDDLTFDAEWANEIESTNNENRRILEGRLSTAQSRLHKDAIRTAYFAIAEHDVRTGRDNYKSLAETMISTDTASTSNANVNAALFRAMDFCSTRIQTAQIGLHIIESAINAGDYGIANDYVERLGITLNSLRSTNSANNNSGLDPYQESLVAEIEVKVQIAKGIERMVAGEYSQAAAVLIPLVLRGSGGGENNDTSQQHGTDSKDRHPLHWPGVTSPEDVALYAGLMCLVTRDRLMMIALADHPEALELVPSVKELLLFWSRANYAPCMRALSESSPVATSGSGLSQPLLPMGGAVDVYLTSSRWDRLIQTIRETCLVEYLRPYQRVKLESLRELFFPGNNNTLDSVIDSIADLMDRKLLPPTTRLDCRENILFQTEAPCDPAPKIRSMEERILDDSHAMLVRLACLEHDFAVQADTWINKKEGRRRHRNHGGRKGMVESSDSSDGDDPYEGRPAAMADTHMIDADPSPPINSAMNPEDMY